MDNSTFLDVDDSILKNNLLLPNEDRDALNHQMDDLMKQFDPKAFLLVQPSPGICVKTKRNDGEKVFINVCIADKIPPPEDISVDRLVKLIEEEVTTYTIPMSIGAERMETDKSGKICTTYDVMINSSYLKKCQQNKEFMAFTILVIISGVADKSGKELDAENFVILKNRAVMGKLMQHRIENREYKKPQCPKPLIEEISHKSTNSKLSLQNNSKTKSGYIILKELSKGSVEHLIALFNMSESISIDNITVFINSDRINVTDEQARYSYDFFLPYTLKTDDAKAFFDYNMKILRLDISIE